MTVPAGYTKRLRGLTAGDPFDYDPIITKVPPFQSVVAAWFTIKTSLDDADEAALVSKRITAAALVDGSAVRHDGYNLEGDGQAQLHFRLTPAETLALPQGPILLWGVQILSSANLPAEVRKGHLIVEQQVTRASS